MSITDKIAQIKQLVNLICEVIPSLVAIIKEIIVVVKDVQKA